MKAKKVAVFTAITVATILVAALAVYGYCKIMWAESEKALGFLDDVDIIINEPVWKYSSFQEYLIQPIPLVALFFTTLLFFFIFLALYCYIAEKIEFSLFQQLKLENEKRAHLVNEINEIEKEIKNLYRRSDNLPPRSMMRKLYSQRISELFSELRVLKYDLEYIQYQIQKIEDKLRFLQFLDE